MPRKLLKNGCGVFYPQERSQKYGRLKLLKSRFERAERVIFKASIELGNYGLGTVAFVASNKPATSGVANSRHLDSTSLHLLGDPEPPSSFAR
jgi:hypothetical protein